MGTPKIPFINVVEKKRGTAAPPQWGRERLGEEPKARQTDVGSSGHCWDRDPGIRGGRMLLGLQHSFLLHLLSHIQFPCHTKSSFQQRALSSTRASFRLDYPSPAESSYFCLKTPGKLSMRQKLPLLPFSPPPLPPS